MDPVLPKVEVFAPFSAAVDLTKRILFQPFDLAKWLTIGFAAFLAGLADWTRFNLGFNVPDVTGRSRTHNLELQEAVRSHLEAWLVGGLIALLVLIAIAAIVLLMWLGSRGRFMFVDCMVRNRGAIAEPWREYRREGNSLFLWSLLITAISVAVAAVCALPLLVPYFTRGEFGDFGPGMLIYVISMVVLFVVAGCGIAFVTWFMVPVMYRQRCSAWAAFMLVGRLILREPAPFIFYALLGVVVLVAGGLLSCVVTCLTCCLAAVPYLGTVILLPLYVFYYAYVLLFLRQFGPEYDVWANVAALSQGSTASEPPSEPPPASPPAAGAPPSEPPPLPA